MSTFMTRRKFGKKGIWSVAAAILTAAVASASLAVAQAPPVLPDGGPGGGQPPIETNCGASLASKVITSNSPSTTNATGFQTLPGATARILDLPAGRCIKVLFTAETACGPSANPDFCYVRAIVNGAPMDPNGMSVQAIDSSDASASAHAYEWVKKLPAGTYTIEIQGRVRNGLTQFYADDWTMDVQTLAP